jgi:ADP-heptose:LPS heptosyltransferase/glycosyltransferase involved in cell wall biosynthesis
MRLLLSKPDSLGDQIIAAGLMQALQRLQPDWQIVWHVRSGMEAIAPLVGAEVFTPERLNPPRSEAARLGALRGKLILLPFPLSPGEPWTADLRQRLTWWAEFLAAIGLVNRNWVGDVTVARAPAAVRIGFAPNAARQTLVNEADALAGPGAPHFTGTLAPSFTRPESAQLRDLLALLEPRLGAIEPPPAWSPVAPAPAAQGSGRRILIAPGVGGDARKGWGVARFLAVAGKLRDANTSITWLEGPGDAPYLAELPAGETRQRFGARELSGLVAALQSADLLLCHDTAYVHLAAALNVPTVAIFGAGQHARFHPTSGRVKIVTSQIACAGCQWHCLWDRLVCVADIPVEAVTRAAVEMLAGNGSLVTVPLATPVASAPEGEAVAVRTRLQEEIITLNADRYARLQIIQSLTAPAAATSIPPSPPGAPSMSVIVPMGRPERVEPTLASLASQTMKPARWQIVLVGVGADQVARSHPELPIVPVALAANVLPPRTRCLGVEQARGEWYLFVDDDVELAPDCFQRFHEWLPNAGGSTPVGAVGFRLPGKSGRFFERLTDISNFWAQQGMLPEDRDWLYSAAMLVRAEAYHRSGGFNPDLPNGEDVDLTRRIVGAGYRLRYEPMFVARHDHRRDTLTSMWRYFWRNGNAARYFFSGHGACPYSVKTVWLKSWSDLRMNQDFQRERDTPLGLITPLVWLNYVIVEASLEWHWQEYLREERRYRSFPARAQSDTTYVRALDAWCEGRRIRGALRYARAVLQDFGNPVRR